MTASCYPDALHLRKSGPLVPQTSIPVGLNIVDPAFPSARPNRRWRAVVALRPRNTSKSGGVEVENGFLQDVLGRSTVLFVSQHTAETQLLVRSVRTASRLPKMSLVGDMSGIHHGNSVLFTTSKSIRRCCPGHNARHSSTPSIAAPMSMPIVSKRSETSSGEPTSPTTNA